jgi:hypothetical protein
MTGGAAEAGPEGPRGVSSEDITGGAIATLNMLARRSGRGEPVAPHEALKRRLRAEIEDAVCSAQRKSTKV